MGFTGAYLIAYNLTCFLGWSVCLAYTIAHCLQNSSPQDLYTNVKLPLQVTQTLAVLEVVHSAAGLVRSPVMTTLTQVFSRIFVVWGIMNAVPEATAEQSLVFYEFDKFTIQANLYTLLTAWGTTEVIRYSFYVTKELGAVPYVLEWLRYTTFIVLYPLGVASELAMIWMALPALKESGLWSFHMPNPANMSFDYYVFCVLAALYYIPGFPPMYMYMFKQRGKVLGKSKSKSKRA